VGINYFYHDFE